jgi:hypothetical protein
MVIFALVGFALARSALGEYESTHFSKIVRFENKSIHVAILFSILFENRSSTVAQKQQLRKDL